MSDAKVLFDYDAEADDELTLKEGDYVRNIEKKEDGWWEGELHGKRGMFPANFVEKIEKPVLDENAGYKHSDASFLFSLYNEDRLPPFKCPIYDHKKDKAICGDLRWGAVFGDGRDFYISLNANTNHVSCSNLGHTYQPPPGYQLDSPQTRSLLAGSYNFQPKEIEVFHR